MIERLTHLRSFGIYRDFQGDEANGVPAFKKRNLIYGWNYSGKTTLSRLLQMLQHPDRPLVHPGGRFTVTLDTGGNVTEVNRVAPYPVRVFNRDYINANFQAEHTAPAVFIVGEENVALRHRLDRLTDAQTRLQAREEERQQLISRIERENGLACTARATTVGQMLGVRDFRKPDLENRIRQVITNLPASLLTDEQRQAAIDTFRSGDQFTEIRLLQSTLPNLSEEVEIVRGLLGRTASFDAIEGLRQNPDLERWLRTGFGLHSDSETCQFCGNPLSPDRVAELGRHFSTASQELLAAVELRIKHLLDLSFEAPRIAALQFMQAVRESGAVELRRLSDWLVFAGGVRDNLLTVLERKRTALEIPLEWNEPTARFTEGTEIVAAVNQVIEQHNERVRNIEGVKRESREAIERHFAAVHFQEQNLAERENQVANLRQRVRHASAARIRLATQAQRISDQIDRAARGAERFMELVAFLLRGSEIRVESFGESQFRLMRGTVAADKLSDGEKTAIAFAYFVTSLEADGEDIANTIVWVDDPISSLDSNHVYAVYALIQERLESARQLFVSTHNSEFFNLLKARWLRNRDRRFVRDSEAFYVRRSNDDQGSFSKMEPLPELLRKYQSEYQFVFAQLHAFSEATTPSEFEAYSAPNLMRRFLEAYLGFQKPDVPEWHEKLDLILDSAEERRELHKLLDDASHLQNLGRALQQPTFVAIAQAHVRAVFAGLAQKDPRHFNSMIAVIS